MSDDSKRPNILWLMTDQHRADCLGCMGHPTIQTPHLDALAAEGVLFRQAYCQSPVCMASRGSVMTGRYPQAISVRGMGILPPAEVTVAEALKRQGYHTGAFGKLHLTPEQYTRDHLGMDEPVLDIRQFAPAAIPPIADDPYKKDYGFDRHVGCDDALQGRFRRWLQTVAPELAPAKPTRFGDGYPGDLWVSPYPSAYDPSTYIATQCSDYLAERLEEDEPWFAFCSFVAPHHPFAAPADQLARYPLDEIPMPATPDSPDPDFIPEPIRAAIGEFGGYTEDAQRRIIQHYLASISLIDDCIGRLIDQLRDAGQLENTIIVFLADHGEFIGDHGLLRKPSIYYDAVMQVPLLMRLPERLAAGRQVDGLVELVDVLPTLLGLADLPAHPGMQGRDWSGELREDHEIGHPDVFSEMWALEPMTHATSNGPYGACVSLRSEDWKLNVYPQNGPEYGQLFDLHADPTELHNLYAAPEHLATRERLLYRLMQRYHLQADPLPLRLTQY